MYIFAVFLSRKQYVKPNLFFFLYVKKNKTGWVLVYCKSFIFLPCCFENLVNDWLPVLGFTTLTLSVNTLRFYREFPCFLKRRRQQLQIICESWTTVHSVCLAPVYTAATRKYGRNLFQWSSQSTQNAVKTRKKKKNSQVLAFSFWKKDHLSASFYLSIETGKCQLETTGGYFNSHL